MRGDGGKKEKLCLSITWTPNEESTIYFERRRTNKRKEKERKGHPHLSIPFEDLFLLSFSHSPSQSVLLERKREERKKRRDACLLVKLLIPPRCCYFLLLHILERTDGETGRSSSYLYSSYNRVFYSCQRVLFVYIIYLGFYILHYTAT